MLEVTYILSQSFSLSRKCHVSSVPVFNSMRRSELKPWGGVVTVGMIICLFVYTGTGVCVCLSTVWLYSQFGKHLVFFYDIAHFLCDSLMCNGAYSMSQVSVAFCHLGLTSVRMC